MLASVGTSGLREIVPWRLGATQGRHGDDSYEESSYSSFGKIKGSLQLHLMKGL
jgi:hypothetical protein